MLCIIFRIPIPFYLSRSTDWILTTLIPPEVPNPHSYISQKCRQKPSDGDARYQIQITTKLRDLGG